MRQIFGENVMFSKDEISRLLAVMGMCSEVRSERDLSEILTGPVRALLPHACVAWGVCKPSTDLVLHVRNIDFPAAFVTGVAQEGKVFTSQVAEQWKRTHTATHFSMAQIEATAWARHEAFARWHTLFRATGLEAVIAHGVTDEEQDIRSYFAFGRPTQHLPERVTVLANILTPHLHGAVVELLRGSASRNDAMCGGGFALSEREREVLTWVQAGKTNYEIGLILGISEFTVKNHMKRICLKLDADNRAHAIAKALHSGFLMHTPATGLRASLAVNNAGTVRAKPCHVE
jgi:transcriptional regulator EpsA